MVKTRKRKLLMAKGKNSGDKYDGDWDNNQMHGHGKYYYKDDSVYHGLFAIS